MGKVDQQFEHLSDAQIENYGDRTGAGPNQPDHSLDQAIETHLAACDGCRTRLLHFHRTRFGLMKDQVPQQTRRSADEAGNPAPKNSAATNPAPKNPAPTARLFPGSAAHLSPDCPSEDALRDLAAGLSSPDAAARLTQHAAQCDHCGPILRAYAEDLSDDLSPEDLTLLSQLNSASPSWQKKMAARMVEAASTQPASAASVSTAIEHPALKDDRVAQPGSPASPVLAGRGGEPPSAVRGSAQKIARKSHFHLPSLKGVLVPTTAIACALIAFFIWSAQRETPQKVEKLLAQAYTEQRAIDLRLPNTSFGQLTKNRGLGVSHDSVPLLRAKQVLSEHENEPGWIIPAAELAILEHDPQHAIDSLSLVMNIKPLPTRPIVLLAIGYVLRGDGTTDREDYNKALELLSRVPHDSLDYPAALYNRALTNVRLNKRADAAADFTAFLSVEKDPAWRMDARNRLADLERH